MYIPLGHVPIHSKQGVSLPFALQSQYPTCAVLLEASPQQEIKQYDGCVLLVTKDEESDATGDFSVLNQFFDQVMPTAVCTVNFSKLFTCRSCTNCKAVQVMVKILSMHMVSVCCAL